MKNSDWIALIGMGGWLILCCLLTTAQSVAADQEDWAACIYCGDMLIYVFALILFVFFMCINTRIKTDHNKKIMELQDRYDDAIKRICELENRNDH